MILEDRTTVYRRLLELVENGGEGCLVTVIEKNGFGPAPSGAKMLVRKGIRIAGTIGGGAVELEALKIASEMDKNGQSFIKKFSFNDDGNLVDAEQLSMICGGNVTLFFEYIQSKERLYIFGAGHVGSAVISHLGHLGFHTTVIDSRENYVDSIEGVDDRFTGSIEEFMKTKKIPPKSFFVIVSHSHATDFEIMKNLLSADLNPMYIGAIASKKKAKMFLEDLKKEFGDNKDMNKLYIPIGLKTGGKTPADIAISIVAEIQSIRYGKTENKHFTINTEN